MHPAFNSPVVDRGIRFMDSITGYLPSALVLATFSMQSMRSLRLTAIASNIAFIVYAVSSNLRPILILHSILLPVNIVRLIQIETERFRRKSGVLASVFSAKVDAGQ